MNANDLIAALGTEFFTGVPDSKLRPLVDSLMDTYGANSPSHIIAANEGNAAALAELFGTSTVACGLVTDPEELFAFRHAFQDRRSGQQLSLFDLYDL